MADVRKAETADGPQAAAALASGFADDPMWAFILGEDRAREDRLRLMFGALVEQAMRDPDHLVFVSDDGNGAALWRPVDGWKVPVVKMLRTAPTFVRALGRRLPVAVRALSALERAHPTEPHYYLEMIATRQGVQSQGIGSALIAAMLERCDREGVPAYLESSNPENIPFYARHGFEPRGEIDYGKGAPVCTAMWRAALC